MLRELLVRREGQLPQLPQSVQPLRERGIEAAPFTLALQQRVELFKLNALKGLPVKHRQALLSHYKFVYTAALHFLYSAFPSVSVRLYAQKGTMPLSESSSQM